MFIETFAVGALGCNCSIIADEVSKEAIVVDPGGDFEKIHKHILQHQLIVKAIVHTHTHIDHVGSTAELQQATSSEARIHEGDSFLYQILPIQAQLIGFRRTPKAAELNAWLKDDELISLGSGSLQVIHTPGHTPGSCCFAVRDSSDKTVLFAGDTLFQNSVGRTDLWGGDSDLLIQSIRKKLFALPEPTRVITGHGPDTTIGHEKRYNPFVGTRA